ncbi:MAG: S8 family serine peptidase, partial [Bacteroidota bacterium]
AIGVIGIAPKAKLAARKVLNDSGGGDFRWIANDIRAIADIPNTGRIKGLKRIISMSLGGAPKQEAPQFLKDAIDYAISKGCFVLAAAGNSGDRGSGAPGNYQPVITIGSTDRPGNIRSSFSARDNSLDFVAPGGRIHSTYKDNGYAIVSGTSMSTPMVAGVVALIVTEFNINTQTDLCKFLKQNATDILSPGKDDLSGWGVPILDKYTSGPSRPDEGIDEPAPSPEPEPEQPYLPRRRNGVAMNMEIPKDEVYIAYWREESEIEVDAVIVKNIELILKTDVLAEQAHEIIIAFLRRVFFEFAFVLPDESDLHDVAVWTAAHAQSIGKEDWVMNEFGTTLDITITSLIVRNRFGNEVKVYTDDIVQSANKLAFGSMDTEVFS